MDIHYTQLLKLLYTPPKYVSSSIPNLGKNMLTDKKCVLLNCSICFLLNRTEKVIKGIIYFLPDLV